jgi:GNAT superfamily N-acetyltransferase
MRGSRMRASWAVVRDHTVGRVFQHGRVRVVEQRLDLVADVPPPSGLTIAPYAGPDWAPLARFSPPYSAARFRRAVARGRTCLVAWRDGRAVGYTWISDRLETDLEVFPLVLPADAAYGWNLRVDPAERSGGIGSALVSARLVWARARGYRRMYRVVAPDNAASLRTVAKTAGTGTRVLGTLHYVRLLRWRWGRLLEAPPEAA